MTGAPVVSGQSGVHANTRRYGLVRVDYPKGAFLTT